ncbi:hypothetical protein GCM10025875_22550 [Litorihabitans aurantiacus]|uniref:Phosphoglucosamine mutase n=1 Tax=Litorihabitans aurantiacus TaxID=1930061 RepID=A0AA37XF52_9MICO|nr:hypothetical protein GCM10025875_22550 [Litorihabitans aurantiacus]
MADNGIKFLSRGGHKLPDDLEDEIAALLGQEWDRPTGPDVGRLSRDTGHAGEQYVEHLLTTVTTDLRGLRIAVDCANGAASEVGPQALREAGADVVVINASPDGRNINEKCGSTHPEQLQATVVASGAAMGVAFDGDADRCLAVDATGTLVDGDQIMGLVARSMQRAGTLAHDTLVVTVMSNLGLLHAMRDAGITVEQTAVGDRYVLERMRSGGFNLGGEQSGHIIMSDHATTGDGVLSALQLAALVATDGPLDRQAATIRRLPQILVNVGGVDRAGASRDTVVLEAVAAAEAALGEDGRVLLRPPGPNRWCASWSRPTRRSAPPSWPVSSPPSSRSDSVSDRRIPLRVEVRDTLAVTGWSLTHGARRGRHGRVLPDDAGPRPAGGRATLDAARPVRVLHDRRVLPAGAERVDRDRARHAVDPR